MARSHTRTELFAPGTIIGGKYRIEAVVGTGRMGIVYRAAHVPGGNVVAIKVLSKRWRRDARAIARFVQEAEIGGRLDHRHIVKVRELGRLSDERPYLVMDYVVGMSLREVIEERRPMRAWRVVHIIRQLLGALEHAHAHGVVHRDLKPANILLTQGANNSDDIRILDYGLARTQLEASRLTGDGAVLGTPAYMAPEQVRGAECDGRVDIYALGLIFYELLICEPAYGRSESGYGYMIQHLRAQPVPFSVANPAVRVPEPLEGVIMTALRKDPNQRFHTAHAMHNALLHAAGLLGSDQELDGATVPDGWSRSDLGIALG